jgi:predicted Zn-dependent protease
MTLATRPVRRLLLAVSAALLTGADLHAQAAASSAVLRARLERFGDAMADSMTARFGPSRDPGVTDDVQLVMKRLLAQSGLAPSRVAWRVLGSEQVNAAALPGGRIVVFEGLVRFAREAARRSNDPGRPERDRYLGLLASALAHELGHVAYGHADSAAVQLIGEASASNLADDPVTARQDTLLAMLQSRRYLELVQFAQSRESDADRYGALLQLRAGWRIQDAMDLFRLMSTSLEAERSPAGMQRDLAESSWLRTHPRFAVREADLEAFRADLKRDQARYDDAVALIENGQMLQTAVQLLDTVLARHPGLAAAHHARAAAFHQAWAAGRSTGQLLVPAVIATLPADILSGIRSGDSGTDELLTAARDGYRRAIQRSPHPLSLASLALLDAYAGDRASARARADSALRLGATDTVARVNAAAAYLVIGDARAARRTYAEVARDVPQAAFGMARAALMLGDTVAADDVLRAYLATSPPRSWAAEARALAPRLATVGGAPSGRRQTAPSAAPPALASIRLGASLTEVMATLGTPASDRREQDARLLTFESPLVQVLLSPATTVRSITAASVDAGDVDGVRVGSATNAALLRWGEPLQRSDGMLVFARATYWLVVRDVGGVIRQLGVAARTP